METSNNFCVSTKYTGEAGTVQSVRPLNHSTNDRRTTIRIPAKATNFLYSRTYRPTLGPTQPPTQWSLRAPLHK